jgi:hypothetical protein
MAVVFCLSRRRHDLELSALHPDDGRRLRYRLQPTGMFVFLLILDFMQEIPLKA